MWFWGFYTEVIVNKHYDWFTVVSNTVVYLCQSIESFYLLVCLSEVTSSLHWSACTCIESLTLVPTLVMPKIINLPYCYSGVKGNNRAGLSSIWINASNSICPLMRSRGSIWHFVKHTLSGLDVRAFCFKGN